MAHNGEDPSSAKKLKKNNLRGPYNQYLSQPGLKIPRPYTPPLRCNEDDDDDDEQP